MCYGEPLEVMKLVTFHLDLDLESFSWWECTGWMCSVYRNSNWN